jgi:hypothetical protein
LGKFVFNVKVTPLQTKLLPWVVLYTRIVVDGVGGVGGLVDAGAGGKFIN